MSAKSWCFTLNNYTSKDEQLFKDLVCNFIAFGKEVGEKKTRHLQGFVTFKNRTGIKALKLIHHRAHWEIAKSTDAAINYTLKEQDYFIKDNRIRGARNDIKDAIIALKADPQTLFRDHSHIYVKYHSGFDKLRFMLQQHRTSKPYVVWLWGPPGAGKTRYVADKEKDLYITSSLKWFDGYENQDAVLFDDFRCEDISYNYFLRLLDRYPVTVPVKGGTRVFNPKRIYITSPYPPTNGYAYNFYEDVNQVIRRLDEIIQLNGVPVPGATSTEGERSEPLSAVSTSTSVFGGL